MASQADGVLELFRITGAYLSGHFRLTSGLHSAEYLQSALVLQHPSHAEELGRGLSTALEALTPAGGIGLVVAPALGGLIVGHEVARALGTPFVFTERDGSGAMTLRRGFTIEPGVGAVVVEDVVTTGGSTREVIRIVEELGATVLCAGSIIDRSGGRADLGVPRTALATLDVIAYPPETCPMCREGTPVSKPGSRPV